MFIYKNRDVSDLNNFQDEAISHNSKIQSVLKFGQDQLRFELSSSLSVQEDLDLDIFINSFEDKDILLSVPKIIGLAKDGAKNKHFSRIIYTSTKDLKKSLIPKRTAVKGEVQLVEWYSEIDQSLQNPHNLVLKVEISYFRNGAGLALFRDVKRTWINEDDSENTESITSRKYYTVNPGDTIEEGIKRRSLIVKNIQVPVLTAMTQTLVPLGYSETSALLKGRSFMDRYEEDFNKFTHNSSSITDAADPDFGKKTVVVKLEKENDVESVEWLDSSPPLFGGGITIRQYLIDQFSV